MPSRVRPASRLTSAKPDSDADFRDRVKYLIDKHFDGNVTEAGRVMGIPQRTFAKIYAGDTANPGLGFIQALCAHFRFIDPYWILLGEENSQERKFESAARAHSKLILKSMLDRLETEDSSPEQQRPGTKHRKTG